jgi:preprotein translocase subunit SecD
MQRRSVNLILILVILAAALWVDLPNPQDIQIGNFHRSHQPILGLDLQGGLQVLLRPPQGVSYNAQMLQDAIPILQSRTNALGVGENSFQVVNGEYILAEFPKLSQVDQVLSVLKQIGQLEFVDFGSQTLPVGTAVQTDLGAGGKVQTPTPAPTGSSVTPGTPSASASSTPLPGTPSIGAQQGTGTPAVTSSAQPTETTTVTGTPSPTTQATGTAGAGAAAGIVPTGSPAPSAQPTPTGTPAPTIYHTILTGANLKNVSIAPGQLGGGYVINFQLDDQGTKAFADYTASHVGSNLAIVLDKKVMSVAQVRDSIPNGQVELSGNFTQAEAASLASVLRYGSLPVGLQVDQSNVVGPSLGADSLQKSLTAGAIGLIIVALFMLLYYRLPGLVAIASLLFFGLVTYAVYVLLPVTLTLPGIAGLLLTIGSALDANILTFERMKDELRSGRTLKQSAELGWTHAWPAIRDSNGASLITSIILFWFGSASGASIVQGFAVTLALGILISVASAYLITRPLLSLSVDLVDPVKRLSWYLA